MLVFLGPNQRDSQISLPSLASFWGLGPCLTPSSSSAWAKHSQVSLASLVGWRFHGTRGNIMVWLMGKLIGFVDVNCRGKKVGRHGTEILVTLTDQPVSNSQKSMAALRSWRWTTISLKTLVGGSVCHPRKCRTSKSSSCHKPQPGYLDFSLGRVNGMRMGLGPGQTLWWLGQPRGLDQEPIMGKVLILQIRLDHLIS